MVREIVYSMGNFPKRKFVNIKWTNKIKKKSYLDKFYKINTNISKKSFEKKIRCTNTEKFKPYIILHKKTFLLKQY